LEEEVKSSKPKFGELERKIDDLQRNLARKEDELLAAKNNTSL
jgi:hypothetical protein